MFSFIISIVVNNLVYCIIVTSLHSCYHLGLNIFTSTFVDIEFHKEQFSSCFVFVYARTFPVIAQAEVKTILKRLE
jgi:molybdopterin-containing oxidoreductase family membrane subunit